MLLEKRWENDSQEKPVCTKDPYDCLEWALKFIKDYERKHKR